MSAETLERSVLERKDREQLVAIASALGLKSLSRAKKSEIVDRILEHTGAAPEPLAAVPASPRPETVSAATDDPSSGNGAAPASARVAEPPTETNGRAAPSPTGRDNVPAAEGSGATPQVEVSEVDEFGEPLADWEIELRRAEAAAAPAGRPTGAAVPGRGPASSPVGNGATDSNAPPRGDSGLDGGAAHDGLDDGAGDDAGPADGGADGPEGERTNRRRRRRRRKGGSGEDGVPAGERPDPGRELSNRSPSSEDAGSGPTGAVGEPVQVEGYLDLRDEGYGFLRVNGYLPSRDDVYVSVKQTRQYGLRKGDLVTGLSRLASRNEKNPALLQIVTVNGADPEEARARPRFEDLTPLFPDEKLKLENPGDPTNMTARIIDLVAPIGKGQRGLVVSPPKAGKTFVMKTIATAIERNNPEVKLLVLLIDERPEEVTDMRRTVKGEVIASTFDRPSDEHTHLAELAIEKAKRLVESGADVVVILDGITRLSRAYNLAAPATGRIMSGGIDAGALYPPKKFFGAARNIEEGGSLTIIATALVETNSRMDDAIFEEFKGTGNMELRLDRKLAERRIFPAIDVDASSTRHEELLFDRRQLQQVWKLRRVLSGLAAEGSAAPGLELLMDRLKTFRNNDDFLEEIAKTPSM